jgi:hypothetical protein
MSKELGVRLAHVSNKIDTYAYFDLQHATAILCFSLSPGILFDIFASISNRSPFTRFASAIQRATSRRFSWTSATLSHFLRSFKHKIASSPNAYVPSSPLPPSYTAALAMHYLSNFGRHTADTRLYTCARTSGSTTGSFAHSSSVVCAMVVVNVRCLLHGATDNFAIIGRRVETR